MKDLIKKLSAVIDEYQVQSNCEPSNFTAQRMLDNMYLDKTQLIKQSEAQECVKDWLEDHFAESDESLSDLVTSSVKDTQKRTLDAVQDWLYDNCDKKTFDSFNEFISKNVEALDSLKVVVKENDEKIIGKVVDIQEGALTEWGNNEETNFENCEEL